jgi:hypothetical protein
MFESKKTPGKKFGSSFAGKRYDEDHSPDGMHKMSGEEKESPAEDANESSADEANESPETNSQDEQNPDEENKDTVHPVVAEHGPAHTIHIKHHEGGKSHVMAHHSDGHTHMSEHESPEDAHNEGRKLAGVPADGQAKDHDSPYHQGKDQAGASSENDSFVMPDLV